MKKLLAMLLVLLLVCPAISASAENDPFLHLESSDTILALQEECEQKGTVVTLDYTAPAYGINTVLNRHEKLEKSVCVYLPYGYDETQSYDVLYLLHGTGGNHEYWLTKAKTGVPTVNMLDNMIAQGLCKPLIVVTPDWNADKKGKANKIEDEKAQAYAESVGNPFINKRNDLWVMFFQQELVNDIMPLVEGQFSTYANGDTSMESLIASRDHRALAGLSRGSMAVYNAGMIGHPELFGWFGCFSGAWANEDSFVASLETAKANGQEILYWYNGGGTEDFALENHTVFNTNVLSRLPGWFTEGENYAFVVKEGSAHTYESWVTDLYNSLMVFFSKSDTMKGRSL